jgi:hypothetical protein
MPDKCFSPLVSLLEQWWMQPAGGCQVCRLLQTVEFVEHFHRELFVSYPTLFEIDDGFFLV